MLAVPVQAAEPFLPSFWDTRAPAEKPDLDGLKTIRFIAGDDYPPFNFRLADGTLVGFNVDLARALCEELQLTCTVQARGWDGILPAIRDGAGDAAIASVAISPGARRAFDFAGPYYKTPGRFYVRVPTSLASVWPEALGGKRIGVGEKTSHEAYLRAFYPRALIRTFASVDDLHKALQDGTVDVAFGDGIAAALWLNGTDAGGCCGFLPGAMTETRFFGEGAGIAVRKGDVALRQALDYALARVAAKGVYTDFYLRYFPIGFY